MMEKLNGLSLELIVHPGETIKEILEDKKMTQEELAMRTGYSAKHVSEVISGKKDISSKFAFSLEYVFNIPTEFWINLQGIYDKEVLNIEKINEIEKNELEVLKELKEVVNYCEDNNIIKKNQNKAATLLEMRKFLGVNNLNIISSLPFQQIAFRGSKNLKVNKNILYAWKKLCDYFTDTPDAEYKFDKEKLKKNCIKIKKTMFLDFEDMIKNLKKIFLECGIVFEVVQNFAGAPVQGYINKKDNKIILCMTIRQSFSDIFWFTMFHEIGHLLNDDYKDEYIDYSFEENECEQKADLYAENALIDHNDYTKFFEKHEFDILTIKKFAQSQNVTPSIVIGRIQKDLDDFTFLANYKEKYKWNIF